MPNKPYIWVLGVVVLAGGFVVGYAMSRTSPPTGKRVAVDTAANATGAIQPSEAPQSESRQADLAAVVHRFPLTTADVKENMETATVAVTDDGAVHVAWASRVEQDKWEVFLATSTDRGETFAAPRVVATSDVHRVTSQSRGKSITREVRMMPRLVSRGSNLLLGWVEAVEGNTAVQYFVARSSDGGKTFSAPVIASRSEGARPTFTSLAINSEGRIAASWLDNRRKTQLPAAAVSAVDGDFESDALVHVPESGKGVCPCCPTHVTFGNDSALYLAFRNQQDGFRDMWISRLPPGATEFEPPKPVVSPTWQFDGCPHDGPSLAVENGRLHVAWMDAHSGQPRVYLAQGDATVENLRKQEVGPEAGHSQGHPALLALDENLYLVWDEGSSTPTSDSADAQGSTAIANHEGHSHGGEPAAGETSRTIRFAHFSSEGKRLGEPLSVAPVAGVFQSRPSLAVHSSGEIYVGWVELSSEGKSIAIARLKREPFTKAVAQDGSR